MKMHYRRKIRRRNKQNTWLLTDDGLCSTKCLFLFNSSKRPPKRQKKQPIQKTHHKFYCDACHLHHTEIHFVTVYSCFYLWSLVFFLMFRLRRWPNEMQAIYAKNVYLLFRVISIHFDKSNDEISFSVAIRNGECVSMCAECAFIKTQINISKSVVYY